MCYAALGSFAHYCLNACTRQIALYVSLSYYCTAVVCIERNETCPTIAQVKGKMVWYLINEELAAVLHCRTKSKNLRRPGTHGSPVIGGPKLIFVVALNQSIIIT